jgi:hypothetical protein
MISFALRQDYDRQEKRCGEAEPPPKVLSRIFRKFGWAEQHWLKR